MSAFGKPMWPNLLIVLGVIVLHVLVGSLILTFMLGQFGTSSGNQGTLVFILLMFSTGVLPYLAALGILRLVSKLKYPLAHTISIFIGAMPGAFFGAFLVIPIIVTLGLFWTFWRRFEHHYVSLEEKHNV